MKARTRRLAGGGAAVAALGAALAAPLWGPPLLREVPWFAAREIEVTGTRLLAPHEVLLASGVRPGVNVWTDPEAWERALERHPVVARARVDRRLPHTLHVRVTERRAVALLQEGVLRPATGDGLLLPVDPARASLDLPLLRAPAGAVAGARVADGGTRAALAELERLAELDPALAARVSEVHPAADGTLRLLLAAPAAEVLLPPGADGQRLAELGATLADLARRLAADSAGAGAGAGGARARVDARWQDQIVVRLRG